ncbi:MAG: hypothetical protein AB7G12_15010 [Thermoanaerobaculia bacterium]
MGDPDADRFDEWEAFLSLDGGRDYSIRLTPHLDAEVRSFAVTLPDLATEEARLLLRFGDGRHEVEEEMPWTFAIEATSPHVRLPRWLAMGRGEAARGGEAGVISWVDGPRDGSSTRQFTAARLPTCWNDLRAARAPGQPQAAPLPRRYLAPSGLAPRIAASIPVAVSCAVLRPDPDSALSVRRRTCRQNE